MMNLTQEEKEMLKEIAQNDTLCEAFAEVLIEEIESDDESYERKGRKIAMHLIGNSAVDVLVDLCGWTVETLYQKAKDREASWS